MKKLLLLLTIFLGAKITQAQNHPQPITAEAIKKMADDKKFTFRPQTAILHTSQNHDGGILSAVPSKLNRVAINGNYSAVMAPDNISSFLPYYGKVEVDGDVTDNTNLKMEENPGKFTTNAFEYTVKQKKKGDVTITVKPANDGEEVDKYVFEFALDGKAKLEFTTKGRTINYEGIFLPQ